MSAVAPGLAPAFADPVDNAQSVFRAVMDAIARPGTAQRLAPALAPPAPLSRGAGAIALAIFIVDTATPLDIAIAVLYVVVVLMAAVASLAAVAVLLLEPGEKDAQAALTIGSVALAWASVHTVFTTRYARIYYTGPDEGVDFNENEPPCYSDFAYLTFTIGMTFQVSDTDLKTKEIRATALKHGLLSYLFGAVIIAAMINLLVSLTSP